MPFSPKQPSLSTQACKKISIDARRYDAGGARRKYINCFISIIYRSYVLIFLNLGIILTLTSRKLNVKSPACI